MDNFYKEGDRGTKKMQHSVCAILCPSPPPPTSYRSTILCLVTLPRSTLSGMMGVVLEEIQLGVRKKEIGGTSGRVGDLYPLGDI